MSLFVSLGRPSISPRERAFFFCYFILSLSLSFLFGVRLIRGWLDLSLSLSIPFLLLFLLPPLLNGHLTKWKNADKQDDDDDDDEDPKAQSTFLSLSLSSERKEKRRQRLNKILKYKIVATNLAAGDDTQVKEEIK